MKCPFCGQDETRVIDSRLNQTGDQIRRRRLCEGCSERFTTLEFAQLNWPRVIKRDQRREQFLEHKLRSGLLRAFEKRPISTEELEQVMIRLKKKLISWNEREITTDQVGAWVCQELKQIDHVAYIRFASVYKRFENINEFYDVLSTID